jgi:hypothetical protein
MQLLMTEVIFSRPRGFRRCCSFPTSHTGMRQEVRLQVVTRYVKFETRAGQLAAVAGSSFTATVALALR